MTPDDNPTVRQIKAILNELEPQEQQKVCFMLLADPTLPFHIFSSSIANLAAEYAKRIEYERASGRDKETVERGRVVAELRGREPPVKWKDILAEYVRRGWATDADVLEEKRRSMRADRDSYLQSQSANPMGAAIHFTHRPSA